MVKKMVKKRPPVIELWRQEIFAEKQRTPAQRLRMAELGTLMHRRLAEMLVENGIIDPQGKTASALQDEVQDRIGELLLVRGYEPQFTLIDYRDDLVREARRFVRSKQYPFALVFYATYFEHWINFRIADGLGKRQFSQDDIKHVIQKVGDVRAKNLLLRALGLPSIPERTLSDVLQTGERRNMYVHYKWTPKSMDSKNDTSYEAVLRNAEKAVARLRRIENRPYQGKKRVLVRSLSRRDLRDADQLLQEVYARIRESGRLMSVKEIDARMKEILAERSKNSQARATADPV